MDLPKSLPRVPKLKNYLCEGEREKAEENSLPLSFSLSFAEAFVGFNTDVGFVDCGL